MLRVYATFVRLSVGLIVGMAPAVCSAVCFYPGKDESGYKVPLQAEVKTVPVIVIGTVVKVRGLHGDLTDPEGYEFWVYTIRVSEVLKGKPPSILHLYTTNDSGGYRMNLGETDILFLRKRGNFYEADICGNSGELGVYGVTPDQVRALLPRVVHAP